LRSLTAIAGALAAFPGVAVAEGPTPAAPITIDGPSAGIAKLAGLSVARDGTGGIVYLKDVGGVRHVFVSRLIGGTFAIPEEIDASAAGPSSQPVIAAGNGGLLLIAFVNGGSLYVVTRPSSTAPYVPPMNLFNGASNPALQITSLGKGYLAFTANDGIGHDVRSAYFYNGQWSLEPSALNVVPADDGSPAGRGRRRRRRDRGLGRGRSRLHPPGLGDHSEHGLRAGGRPHSRLPAVRLERGVGRPADDCLRGRLLLR
jgi:hypothetical protein